MSLCGLISCVSQHKHLLVHLSCHSITKTKQGSFSSRKNEEIGSPRPVEMCEINSTNSPARRSPRGIEPARIPRQSPVDSTQAGGASCSAPPRFGSDGDERGTPSRYGGKEQSAQKSKGRGGSKAKGRKGLEGRRRMRKSNRGMRFGPL